MGSMINQNNSIFLTPSAIQAGVNKTNPETMNIEESDNNSGLNANDSVDISPEGNLSKEITQYEEKLESANKDLNSAKGEVSKSSDELNKANDEVSQLEKELGSAKNKPKTEENNDKNVKEAPDNKVKDIEARLNKAKENAENKKNTLEELTNKEKTAQEEINKLKLELENKKAELDKASNKDNEGLSMDKLLKGKDIKNLGRIDVKEESDRDRIEDNSENRSVDEEDFKEANKDINKVSKLLNGPKYVYQGARALAEKPTSTALTSGLDLINGSTSMVEANSVSGALKATSTTIKGAIGAGKLSAMEKVADFAGNVAPAVAKGSVLLGAGLGGLEIGDGINEKINGNHEKGNNKIANGSLDVGINVALGVAATIAPTAIGAPIAATALVTAGVLTAAKHREDLYNVINAGIEAVGLTDVAEKAGNKIEEVTKKVVDPLSRGYDNSNDLQAEGARLRTEAMYKK